MTRISSQSLRCQFLCFLPKSWMLCKITLTKTEVKVKGQQKINVKGKRKWNKRESERKVVRILYWPTGKNWILWEHHDGISSELLEQFDFQNLLATDISTSNLWRCVCGWVLKANHGFLKLVSRPTHCWNFYLWSCEQPHIYGEPAKLQNKEYNQNKCVWKDIR